MSTATNDLTNQAKSLSRWQEKLPRAFKKVFRRRHSAETNATSSVIHSASVDSSVHHRAQKVESQGNAVQHWPNATHSQLISGDAAAETPRLTSALPSSDPQPIQPSLGQPEGAMHHVDPADTGREGAGDQHWDQQEQIETQHSGNEQAGNQKADNHQADLHQANPHQADPQQADNRQGNNRQGDNHQAEEGLQDKKGGTAWGKLVFMSLFFPFSALVAMTFLLPWIQIQRYGVSINAHDAFAPFGNYANESLLKPMQMIWTDTAPLTAAICTLDDFHCYLRPATDHNSDHEWFVQRAARMEASPQFPIACPQRPCQTHRLDVRNPRETEIALALDDMLSTMMDMISKVNQVMTVLWQRHVRWTQLETEVSLELWNVDNFLFSAAQAAYEVSPDRLDSRLFVSPPQVFVWTITRRVFSTLGYPLQIDRLERLLRQNDAHVQALQGVIDIILELENMEQTCRRRLDILEVVIGLRGVYEQSPTYQVIRDACQYCDGLPSSLLSRIGEGRTLWRLIREGVESEVRNMAANGGGFGELIYAAAAVPLLDEKGRKVTMVRRIAQEQRKGPSRSEKVPQIMAKMEKELGFHA